MEYKGYEVTCIRAGVEAWSLDENGDPYDYISDTAEAQEIVAYTVTPIDNDQVSEVLHTDTYKDIEAVKAWIDANPLEVAA